ncbi:MAG TPA: alpha/beta hydrolase-fold protein [Segetibacter sp.]
MFNRLFAGRRTFLPFLISLVSFFIIQTVNAQNNTSSVILPGAFIHNFHSKTNGQDYKLFVSLPDSYSVKDTVHYPVLYLLDGNPFFPLLQCMQKFYFTGEELPEMIIVGIGYHTNTVMESMPNRTLDYTPTNDTAFDNMLTKELKMRIKSGGAFSFLKTLRNDILPFVESQYKTSKDRAIAGHSFGALFGAYVLFHQPELFNRYLLSSVSMPWDKDEMLKEELDFFKAGHRVLNAHVYVTVGDKEEFNMKPLMKQLVKSMREHNYQGLVLEEHILENESHTSAITTAFNHGMRALYKISNKENK